MSTTRATTGGVRVDGLNKLVRDLQTMGIEITDLKEVFGALAQEAAQIAAGLAPHGTGRLAASVRGSHAKNYATVKAGGARIPYAGAINYGWAKHNIQPSLFMQRADQMIRPRALRTVRNGIEKLIRQRSLS